MHNTYQYYDINKISSLVYYKFNDYLQLHDKEGQYTDLYVENTEEYLEQRYAINQLVLFSEKVPIVNIFASIGLWPWLFLFALLYNLKWKKKEAQALFWCHYYDRSLYGVAGQWKYTLCYAAFIYIAVFDTVGIVAGKVR